MPRKAKSDAQKAYDYSILKEHWENVALDRYLDALDQIAPKTRIKGGLQKFIDEAIEECKSTTRKTIYIAQQTLSDRKNGRMGIREANASKRWLSDDEEEEVVDYAIAVAQRGFPLSHRRLKEHVNEIIKGKTVPDDFPAGGVGTKWTQRFATRHNGRLQQYWSHPLDHSRARAVNPTTKKEFFVLLDKVIQGEFGNDDRSDVILDKNIYGMDESSIQEGLGTKERVFGARGKGIQHQQRGGARENTTAIVTIGYAGDTPAGAIIYKAAGYQLSWRQDNPLGVM